MLGLLAFVKTADAQVRLDLDNELEEAFFATKEQVKSIKNICTAESLRTRLNKKKTSF